MQTPLLVRGAELFCLKCFERRFRQLVLIFESITTSNGWRIVVVCGGRHSKCMLLPIVYLMMRVDKWERYPSINSKMGFVTSLTVGTKWWRSQSKNVVSSLHLNDVELKRVPGKLFLGKRQLVERQLVVVNWSLRQLVAYLSFTKREVIVFFATWFT